MCLFLSYLARYRSNSPFYFESEKIEDQKSQIPPLDNFRPFFLSNSVATEIQVDRRQLFLFLSAALFVFT